MWRRPANSVMPALVTGDARQNVVVVAPLKAAEFVI
jgi:hypothetical protein